MTTDLIASGRVRQRTFTAMASPITLRLVGSARDADARLDAAERVLREVARTCSRHDPTSPLAAANRRPSQWHEVPASLGRAVVEAHHAHRVTGGLFDPRVLDTLLAWGDDGSLTWDDSGGTAVAPARSLRPGPDGDGAPPEPWRPRVRRSRGAWWVHLGGQGVDLGGIAKGLAVRWAVAALAGPTRAGRPAHGEGALVDAGGDGVVVGAAPGAPGRPWRLGVEDPAGGTPVLVLAVADTAYATSSTRRRRWVAGGERVHHLIDPRTRRPGGAGLAAVTVLAPDPARAEAWSTALFLAGADGVRALAERRALAAAWVRDDGSVGLTDRLRPHVIWAHPEPDRSAERRHDV